MSRTLNLIMVVSLLAIASAVFSAETIELETISGTVFTGEKSTAHGMIVVDNGTTKVFLNKSLIRTITKAQADTKSYRFITNQDKFNTKRKGKIPLVVPKLVWLSGLK